VKPVVLFCQRCCVSQYYVVLQSKIWRCFCFSDEDEVGDRITVRSDEELKAMLSYVSTWINKKTYLLFFLFFSSRPTFTPQTIVSPMEKRSDENCSRSRPTSNDIVMRVWPSPRKDPFTFVYLMLPHFLFERFCFLLEDINIESFCMFYSL